MSKKMSLMDKAEAIIRSKSGVLMAWGKPGTGKSAVMKKIADKNGWNYIDLRLSTKDSADISGLPTNVDIGEGKDSRKKIMTYSIPEWAYLSNQRPTLINFEELNRCDVSVLRTSLQPLNERMIGYDFEFNKDVYMCATGNSGDEDDCDTEELDGAMHNRLVHLDWNMTYNEWVDEFAAKNVISHILNFLNDNPDHLYKKDKPTDKSFATERSWTNLSNFVKSYSGTEEPTTEQTLEAVVHFGKGYIGNASNRFMTYLQERLKITINDVINNFSKIKTELEKCRRDKFSELLRELLEFDFNKFTAKKLANVIEFMKIIDVDERVGFLKKLLLDTKHGETYLNYETKVFSPNFKIVWDTFETEYRTLQKNREKYADKDETKEEKKETKNK